MLMLVCVALACAGRAAATAAGARGGLLAGWTVFDVDSIVVASDPGSAAPPSDLGWRMRASLAVHALSPDTPASTLLAFQLSDIRLLLRGSESDADYVERECGWEGRAYTAYGEWGAGDVEGDVAGDVGGDVGGDVARLRHAPATPPRLLDYLRALISLFRYRAEDGARNETDVSGACDTLYETVAPDAFRKVKRRCDVDAAVGADVRRVVRYTLAPDRGSLAAVYADEVATVRVGDLALKARSLHTLAQRDRRPAPPASAPAEVPPDYVEAPLELSLTTSPDPDDIPSAEEAVREWSAALEGEEAGGGGTARGAAALLRLLPALRAATAEALTTLLRVERPLPELTALCRALGATGTPAAAAAVRRADLPPPLVRAYLAGLGAAPAPAGGAVEDALALAQDAALHEAALLAAAAAAPRAGDAALLTRVRDHLTKGLAKCKDDICRRVYIAALGNTRAAEATATLAAHAAAGGGGAGAALAALEHAPSLAPHLALLAALAGNASRPLEERAAALDLLATHEARGAALPLRTGAAWAALAGERTRAAAELRRLLEQRVAALGGRHEAARRLLAARPARLRGWDAPAGSSSVLERETGWAAGGWLAELDSRQVAERGMLRRGRVALAARRGDDAPVPLLGVEVWARGLAALAGAEDAPDEAPAAGLALSLAGVALPHVPLFEGQGELVGHIWAGTGAADTAVLRGAAPLLDARGALPLAGGVVVGVRRSALLAAALDARASVSLWQRAARAALTLRGAAAARVALRLAPPGRADRLRLEAHAEAAPRLRIHADLDFYDGVALCVRAATAPHEEARDTVGEATQGAREWRVTRRRAGRVTRAGRTLALGRENDVACRTLRSADDDDDDV